MVFSPVHHVQRYMGLEPLPRRILMTADPIGGVWSYVLELAHGLNEYGIEIALATMGAPLSDQQHLEIEQEKNVTVFESEYRLEWMDDPWEDVAHSGDWLLALEEQVRPDLIHLNGYCHAALPFQAPCMVVAHSGDWLLALEEQVRPDLIHLNGYCHAALPFQAPCMVVAHSCMTSWWEAVRKEELPLGFEPYRSCVAKGLAAADMVVAPTAAMLHSVERFYQPVDKGRVIYNARSRNRFRPGRKKDFILCVGRLWDEAKNISTLAKTAYRLPWPVYVAGEQKHPGGGTAAFDGINRLGFLDQDSLVPWYAAAKIYALPARYEPFGLTILEAALSGCALVLGDIPSLRELWEDVAVFVDPDDDEALVRELRSLCADSQRVADLGERALMRSRSYNIQRMVAGYLSAYRELDPDISGREEVTDDFEGGD